MAQTKKNERTARPTLKEIKRDFLGLARPSLAKNLSRFFKTGPGQYGSGDKFLGVKVPVQRTLVKKYRGLPLNDVVRLLKSPIHEYRLTALLILVDQFKRAGRDGQRARGGARQEKIFDVYLKNARWINNWDLVDSSAPYIVGEFLRTTGADRQILYKLVRSKSLWERRIAILSTASFIKYGDTKDALNLSEILLQDDHDLLHKAVGWMLREVGDHDQKLLEKFLSKHAAHMPRTALRYALEHFPGKKRAQFMNVLSSRTR